MKKIFALVLMVALCLTLIACGSESKEPEKTPREEVQSAVKSRVMTEVVLSYNITGVPTVTTYVRDLGNNNYMVTGKVTVKDSYGDSYTGKYDAEVEYNPESGSCYVDLELGSLYKD